MDPSTIDGLSSLIGSARLSTYLDAYQGREDLALRLYSWNAALSSALWGPLGVLEVVVRNALHTQLAERTGRQDWWADSKLNDQLLPRERGAISDAVVTVGGRREEPSPDLDTIRRTRNRVAHHEPIFRTNLGLLGNKVALVAGYVDPAAETYIRGSECLTTVLEAKRAFIADGQTSF